MFFFLVFIIWAAVLSHVFYRTKGLLGLRACSQIIFGLAFYFAGFGYVLIRVMIAKNIGEEFTPALEYASAWFIGIVTILWTLLFVFEMGAAAVWVAKRRRIRNAPLRLRRTMAAILWGVAGILSLYGFNIARSTPALTKLQLTVPLAEPRRFVLILDAHLGASSSADQWRRTLQAARKLRPDAILIPGDLVDDYSRHTRPQVALLREFFPETKIYATTGNHEFYNGPEQFKDLCKRLNLRLLRQEVETLSPGLSVAGIDDKHFLSARKAVEKVRPKLKGAVLFLSHRPAVAHLLRDRPMTLALAGHTHGGQSLPMVFLVALANGGFRSGCYKVGKACLYVSNGTGVWGPPMRLLAPPEIVLIEVRPGPRFEVQSNST